MHSLDPDTVTFHQHEKWSETKQRNRCKASLKVHFLPGTDTSLHGSKFMKICETPFKDNPRLALRALRRIYYESGDLSKQAIDVPLQGN